MAPIDAYIRVSRVLGRSGESYISPSVQRDAIQRWADYKHIEIGEWHVDEDWSGGTHQRPGLERAIQRAVSGQTGGIVAWKIDRFSRMTEHGLRDLRRLEDAGARLAFVTEDIDTSGPMGKFVYVLMLAMAELFLDNIKAAWVTAKTRAIDRGAVIGPTPFGYRRRDDGTLEPDPRQGPLVTEAYRLAAGRGLPSAAEHLEVHAPGRRWNTATVRRLLASRVYLGEARYGDLVQADAHEPLVSRSGWEAAQAAPSPRKRKAEFPLTGIPVCDSCGTHLVGSRGGSKDNRVRVYRCAATLSTFRGDKCAGGPTILADALEAFLRDRAREILSEMQVEIARPHDANRLAKLEREAVEAEVELAAFADDLTARRLLGDRYHDALQARVDDAERKQAAYRKLASEALAEHTIPSADMLDDPVLFPLALRGIFDSITVRRGRGLAVADRVVLVEAQPDLGAGVAGPELGK